MPGDGGKWTCGMGGNGMPFGHDAADAEAPIVAGWPDGTWGQEPYAWGERYGLGRVEDLREERGRG